MPINSRGWRRSGESRTSTQINARKGRCNRSFAMTRVFTISRDTMLSKNWSRSFWLRWGSFQDWKPNRCKKWGWEHYTVVTSMISVSMVGYPQRNRECSTVFHWSRYLVFLSFPWRTIDSYSVMITSLNLRLAYTRHPFTGKRRCLSCSRKYSARVTRCKFSQCLIWIYIHLKNKENTIKLYYSLILRA